MNIKVDDPVRADLAAIAAKWNEDEQRIGPALGQPYTPSQIAATALEIGARDMAARHLGSEQARAIFNQRPVAAGHPTPKEER